MKLIFTLLLLFTTSCTTNLSYQDRCRGLIGEERHDCILLNRDLNRFHINRVNVNNP